MLAYSKEKRNGNFDLFVMALCSSCTRLSARACVTFACFIFSSISGNTCIQYFDQTSDKLSIDGIFNFFTHKKLILIAKSNFGYLT